VSTVKYIEMATTHEVVEFKDHFTFRKDRKHYRLQRFALWILRKLGCYSNVAQPKVSYHEFNPKNILEGILGQKGGILKSYDYRGEYVLMGPKQFDELGGFLEVNKLFSFKVEVYSNERVFDMKIIIIPWMDGVLVVPGLERYAI